MISITPLHRFSRLSVLIASLVFLGSTAMAASTSDSAPTANSLSVDFIYKYLVGEVAGQRGELGLASNLFLDLAKSSRDAGLAERAAKAAVFGNNPTVAIQAVSLWSELDPDSVDAQQTTVQMLLGTNRLAETKPYLEKLLQPEATRANGFLYLHTLFAGQSDKAAVLTLVQDLAARYPSLPEAHFAVTQAARSAGQSDLALEQLIMAQKLRPDWQMAAILHGQLLYPQSPDAAIDYFRNFLDEHPDADETRLAYARLLVNQKRFDAARAEFVTLTKNSGDNPEILAVVGLLSFQSGAYDEAAQYYQQALDAGYGDSDQIYLYLGHNAEKQNQDQQALEWYDKIQPGARYLGAKLNTANVLSRTQGTEAGIKTLQALDELDNEQQVIVNQAISSLLMQAKRIPEAYTILENTINSLPNTPELIYDFSMAAERLQKYDVMERELRKLILLKPDFSPAYNALGYSFADRNINLQEAHDLIETALRLSPDDYYILDSMGWVHYRMGSLDKALKYLQQAYLQQTDPEIAAHLGEVLWKKGQYDQAIRTWEEALQTHPDNETLLNTSKRFHQ